jgi:flavoprotein
MAAITIVPVRRSKPVEATLPSSINVTCPHCNKTQWGPIQAIANTANHFIFTCNHCKGEDKVFPVARSKEGKLELNWKPVPKEPES